MRYRFLLSVLLLTVPSVTKAQGPLPKAPTNQTQSQDAYSPITGTQRLKWFAVSSVGPTSLVAGLFSAGIGTARNKPYEYGTSWDGYGKRYGMRLTSIVAGNAMEAGLGAIWGEDPRYFRAEGRGFGGRIGHIIVMTFAAKHGDGHLMPAYARYLATPGSNFLSNTWREPSESTVQAAFVRTALGFAGRMGSNAFQEFWPSVKHGIFHK